MGQPGNASWVSKAVSWVATQLRGAFVWLHASTRDRPADTLRTEADQADAPPAPAAAASAASEDRNGARRHACPETVAWSLDQPECHLDPAADDAPWTAAPASERRHCGEPASVEQADIEPLPDAGAQGADDLTQTAQVESPPAADSGNAAPAIAPAACAPEKAWLASREQAERLAALLEGSPVRCGSAGAEELMALIDDEDFSAIATLIAGSDRAFDDLRLPAAKHVYERIMARPLGLREPVRFREPVHDLGVRQMLYAALRELARREGAPLIIPPASATSLRPTGEVVADPAWWSCDALGQELKAPDPDLRAANGRVLARLFPHLSADVLQPALIATLASAPKARRKAAVGSNGSPRDARSARQTGPGPGPGRAVAATAAGDATPSDDPLTDAAMIPGDPAAAIWLRGHGTAAWTIRLAMSRGTRMLDAGELDRVRREIELAAWQRTCRRRVVAAVAAYVADPRGYDIESVKKRLARRDVDPAADTPFAFSGEQALFDAWRRVRREADIPFDRSIGMPTVNVLAPDLIARIASPFCAVLGVARGDPSTPPAPVPEPQCYAYDLRDDAA
jgi:hypothetical protein